MANTNRAISAILSELGWDENLAVPIANKENKELIALVSIRINIIVFFIILN